MPSMVNLRLRTLGSVSGNRVEWLSGLFDPGTRLWILVKQRTVRVSSRRDVSGGRGSLPGSVSSPSLRCDPVDGESPNDVADSRRETSVVGRFPTAAVLRPGCTITRGGIRIHAFPGVSDGPFDGPVKITKTGTTAQGPSEATRVCGTGLRRTPTLSWNRRSRTEEGTSIAREYPLPRG